MLHSSLLAARRFCRPFLTSRLPSCYLTLSRSFTTVEVVHVLPRVVVEVTYTNDAAAIDEWLLRHVNDTSGAVSLGLDCEWAPHFYGPPSNPNISTIQLATSSAALVAHVSHLIGVDPSPLPATSAAPEHSVGSLAVEAGGGIAPVEVKRAHLPGRLTELLNNPSAMFVGAGVREDLVRIASTYSSYLTRDERGVAHLLRKHHESRACTTALAVQRGIEGRKSLQQLATTLLGWPKWKTKSITMSNWEAMPLSPSQVRYAAIDAVASLAVWTALKDMPRVTSGYPIVNRTSSGTDGTGAAAAPLVIGGAPSGVLVVDVAAAAAPLPVAARETAAAVATSIDSAETAAAGATLVMSVARDDSSALSTEVAAAAAAVPMLVAALPIMLANSDMTVEVETPPLDRARTSASKSSTFLPIAKGPGPNDGCTSDRHPADQAVGHTNSECRLDPLAERSRRLTPTAMFFGEQPPPIPSMAQIDGVSTIATVGVATAPATSYTATPAAPTVIGDVRSGTSIEYFAASSTVSDSFYETAVATAALPSAAGNGNAIAAVVVDSAQTPATVSSLPSAGGSSVGVYSVRQTLLLPSFSLPERLTSTPVHGSTPSATTAKLSNVRQTSTSAPPRSETMSTQRLPTSTSAPLRGSTSGLHFEDEERKLVRSRAIFGLLAPVASVWQSPGVSMVSVNGSLSTTTCSSRSSEAAGSTQEQRVRTIPALVDASLGSPGSSIDSGDFY